MRTVNLMGALKLLGYELIQKSKGYNYRSGFMRKDGQLYYYSYSDLRDSNPTLMIRTADETKLDKKGKYNDYTGGSNTYPRLYGIKIYEPRGKGDYNKC